MAFRVGQRVCCVDASSTAYGVKGGPIFELELRAIYTVAWIGDSGGLLCIRLSEIPLRYLPPGATCEQPDDLPFRASRFRPVVSTDTGMAVLEQIRRDMTNKELRPIFEEA